MEQSVAERPRRSIGSFTGDSYRQDIFPKPLCRDNLRGSCARGANCKYQHSESNGSDGSRFYPKEPEMLVAVADSRPSHLYKAAEENDTSTRFSSRGRRIRSPCRRFQSGRCYNGASCPYWHPELTSYDRASYGASFKHKQAGRTEWMSQGSHEAFKENGFRTIPVFGEHRSRSPCRNFLRGNCSYGASCRRLHPVARSEHDLSTQHQQGVAATSGRPGFGEISGDVTLRTSQVHDEIHNRARTGDIFREPSGRSPCRYFLRSKRYQGVSSTSRTSDFGNGSIANSSRISRNHEECMNSGDQSYQDMHVVYEQNNAPSIKDDMRFAARRVDEDVAPSNWCYDRQRSRSVTGFGVKNLEREVCIQFTKGRCNRGEFCKHLHGYHYFASCDWKKFNAEASRNFSGATQNGNTMMAQGHDEVKNNQLSFGENKLAANSLVTPNDCFDKEITGRSLCDVTPENDQNGDVLATGECGISGKIDSRFCSSAELHEDVSLKSRPFKKQNSRARSPFTSRDDFHCRKLRRSDSQVDSRIDEFYHVAGFQSPDRCSYKYQRSLCHTNNLRPSEGESNSVIPCHSDNGSHLVSPQRHVEVASQSLQLDQCPEVSLGSNIAANSMKNEVGDSRCILHPSHKGQSDEKLAKDSITVDNSEGTAAISHQVSVSDFKSKCGEDNISPSAVELTLGTEGNAEMTVIFAQGSNENTAELIPTVQNYSRKKRKKKGPKSVSAEALKEEITNAFELMPTSSLIENSSSNPDKLSSVSGISVDAKTSSSKNQDIEDVDLQEHPAKKKINKKINKKCSQSLSCEGNMNAEVTTASDKEISSSSLVETSSGKSTIFYCVTGVSVDVISSATNRRDLENGLMHDYPAKKKKKKFKKKHPEAVPCKETVKEAGMPNSSLPLTSSDPYVKSASGIPVHQKSIASKGQDLEIAIRPLKKRKKGTKSLSCENDNKKEETCASKLELPTSFLVETSLGNSNILSTPGIPINVELGASQRNNLENVVTDDGPVEQQDNGSISNKTVDCVKPSLATAEHGTLVVDCAHSRLLQSLPKAVNPNSRRKLLVLDVNGLLVDIVAHHARHIKPEKTISRKAVFKRPFCDDFLQFCLERFNVGIWSSRTRKNLDIAVNFLMKDTKERLFFCWDQSHCTPTGCQTIENKAKPLVLKELHYLWDNKERNLPWEKGWYDETNTVLLDDSPYKALRNPPFTAIFPYPYKYWNLEDNALGPSGDLRLHLERLAGAENVQKFIQENPFGQNPITPSSPHWGFYSKIACTCGIDHFAPGS